MSTAVHVPLAEYLNTEYEPDCEYVDGVLEERNVGKKKHSRTQTLLARWLGVRESQHGHEVLVEQRVRISASRFRIPDICLVPRDETDEVIQRPPVLWIEILSPEDRWSRIQAKVADVLRFGVGTIWIVDPYTKQGWIVTATTGAVEVEDSLLRCADPALEVGLNEILPQD